ncbi:MAG: peroxiredoxin [Gammaproteobacteria bacterium]|nr:peroxiredoxin [Gammaproteobacteria bacterium]
MLQVGQMAPVFSSPDQNGQTVNSSDFKSSKNIVLYFYPKDDTPGCTIEANDFTALADEFTNLDTLIIGVSKDDCTSHMAFIEKFKLNLVLLADTSGKVCSDYNVWQQKEKNGVKKMGIVRSTFIINKQGELSYVKYSVIAKGHADEILHFIKNNP